MNGRAEGRADFEDQMAQQLARPGIQAVPSYTLLPRPEATPIDLLSSASSGEIAYAGTQRNIRHLVAASSPESV